jgi:hypothetical protein
MIAGNSAIVRSKLITRNIAITAPPIIIISPVDSSPISVVEEVPTLVVLLNSLDEPSEALI